MANIHLLLDTLRYTVSWIAFRDGIYHFCFILPVTAIDSEKKEEKKEKKKRKETLFFYATWGGAILLCRAALS